MSWSEDNRQIIAIKYTVTGRIPHGLTRSPVLLRQQQGKLVLAILAICGTHVDQVAVRKPLCS